MKNLCNCLLISVATTVIEICIFMLSWQISVEISSHHGREFRGGVAFGVTTTYGFWLFSLLASVGNFIWNLVKIRHIHFSLSLIFLSVWGLWCWPSTNTYPVRGATFLVMGVIFYICGIITSNKIARIINDV